MSISCSLNLWTKSQAIENNLFVVSPCHGRPQMGTKREIETENQDFPENMKLATQFQSIDLIFAMPVYLPVWHSHCLRTRFTVLVSCSSELAVHSCPLLCVAKFGCEFFRCWSLFLLRNNTMAANLHRFASSYDGRRFAFEHWCHA